jgi:hypothetical protein
MIGERERPPLIEADHLECPVTPIQAIVLHRHGCLGRRADPSVDAGQLGYG